MKIAIVDDDKAIHEQIKSYISDYFGNDTVAEICDVYSGDELLGIDMATPPIYDIIFLDIKLGTQNGMDCAKELRKKYPDIIIIFVSSHKEYVFDAFRCEAFHFIVKPIRDSEFNDVFGRAINKYKMLNSTYTVTWRNSRNVLRINDITYIEGYCRRLKVHTTAQVYEHIGKVSTAYKTLATHDFLMIHQSFIVNMQYISHFGKELVTLIDDTQVPIAGRKRPEALKQFDLFLKKRKW